MMPRRSFRIELRLFGRHCSAPGAHLTPPLAAHASQHSAGLVLHSARGVEVGSATFIRLAERYFVATAGHNLDPVTAAADIRVVPVATGGGQRLPIIGAGASRERGPGAGDVGWLELDAAAASCSALRFLALEHLALDDRPSHDKAYFVQGMPAQLARRLADGRRRLRLISLGYMTVQAEPAPAFCRDRGEMYLAYDEATLDRSSTHPGSLPPADGMSGGGVWAVDRADNGLWHADQARLVGILRSWHRGHRHLTSVGIRHWLTQVRDDVPELRQLLDPLLAGAMRK